MEDGAVIHDGLGHTVVQILGMLYEDYGLLVSQEPECLQGKLNSLIGLFRRIVLAANFSKSNTMDFHPGVIRSSMSEEDFYWIITGERATYWEHLRRRVPCPECWAEMTAVSLI